MTPTLERGETTFVIRYVLAEICSHCGEEYLDEQTSKRSLQSLKEMSVQVFR